MVGSTLRAMFAAACLLSFVLLPASQAQPAILGPKFVIYSTPGVVEMAPDVGADLAVEWIMSYDNSAELVLAAALNSELELHWELACDSGVVLTYDEVQRAPQPINTPDTTSFEGTFTFHAAPTADAFGDLVCHVKGHAASQEPVFTASTVQEDTFTIRVPAPAPSDTSTEPTSEVPAGQPTDAPVTSSPAKESPGAGLVATLGLVGLAVVLRRKA